MMNNARRRVRQARLLAHASSGLRLPNEFQQILPVPVVFEVVPPLLEVSTIRRRQLSREKGRASPS